MSEEKHERCHVCGQFDAGQTGESPCPQCGLSTLWDDWPEHLSGEAFAMMQEPAAPNV